MSLCNVVKLNQEDFYFTFTKHPLFMPHAYPQVGYPLIKGVQMEKTIVPHLQLQFSRKTYI